MKEAGHATAATQHLERWTLQILGPGPLTRPGGLLAEIAARHGATPGQVALAWLLRRSPLMLPIPGTSRVAHLEENVAAASLRLTDDEFAALTNTRLAARGK